MERRAGSFDLQLSELGAALSDRLRVRVMAVALIAGLGVVDWISGPNVAFSVFYLLPVSALAWTSSRRWAVAAAILSAASWIAADAAGQAYSHALIPVWNVTTRLTMFLIVSLLVSHLRVTAEHERKLARIDFLTGVANSRWFYESAQAVVAAARSSREVVTLLYIDLDDFKKINDRCGHSGGDDVLRLVGEALRASTRSHDLVGRVGGDEFAILIPSSDRSAAEAAVKHVGDRVADGLAYLEPPVTCSIGAVTFVDVRQALDNMIEAADDLMYQVKRTGKKAVHHRVEADISA
jgi:diguanylate cyclase (GGDEF)-like protein